MKQKLGNLQYKMFLLNNGIDFSVWFARKFTIQNVPIKYYY